MWKSKVGIVIKYIVKHSKIMFPVFVIGAVAATVSIALGAGHAEEKVGEVLETSTEESIAEETVTSEVEEEIAMALNEDPAIHTLIATFYNAMALGDADALLSVCDEISKKDMLSYQERAKYIETYPVIEIYTKPGPEEGSNIAFIYYKVVFSGHEEQFPGYTAHYICTDEQGELYIKRGEISEEENQYIGQVMLQDDVVEFNNHVTVEYNGLMKDHPELLEYLREMDAQVSAAVGVALAQENTVETQEEEGEATNTEEGEVVAENPELPTEETPAVNVIQYVTTTAAVNVRSSDSEQADKLGKVTRGTKLQLIEQKVNGWTKVLYEGNEGYIKSEFLELAESAEGMTAIGTVRATTNINVRASASETSDKLGVLIGGDTADLYANENGWCKIKYGGGVGYVKSDYVEIN